MYHYQQFDIRNISDKIQYQLCIDKIEDMRNQKWNNHILQSNMKGDIYHSTNIEGNTMSRDQVTIVLEAGVTIRGKSLKEHLQVINYKEALEVLKNTIQNKDFDLTEDSIKQIHQIVTTNELDFAESGQYRQEPVHIRYTDYIPPNEYKVPEYMKELCEMYHRPLESDTQFERICEFKQNFEKIHPFIDGNGRTGRLLMNMLFLQEGYGFVTIPAEERDLYFDSLDSNSFVEYAAPKMAKTMERLIEKDRGREAEYER